MILAHVHLLSWATVHSTNSILSQLQAAKLVPAPALQPNCCTTALSAADTTVTPRSQPWLNNKTHSPGPRCALVYSHKVQCASSRNRHIVVASARVLSP